MHGEGARGTKRKQKIHVTVKKVYTRYIAMMYAVRTWGQSKVDFLSKANRGSGGDAEAVVHSHDSIQKCEKNL